MSAHAAGEPGGRVLDPLLGEGVADEPQERVSRSCGDVPLVERVLRELVGLAPGVEQQRRVLRTDSAAFVPDDVVLLLEPSDDAADEPLVRPVDAGDLPLADRARPDG